MATVDWATQLANVNAAILKAEEAQAYGIRGRNVTRANLDALYKRQITLSKIVDAQNRGSMASLGVIVRPG